MTRLYVWQNLTNKGVLVKMTLHKED